MANEILMSLLSPEQRSQAQEDAFRQGLLGLSTGLIQAAIPQGGRGTSTLQALAQAAPGAVGAYKGAFDQTLKDLLTGMQVKDMMAKREQEAAQRQAIQNFIARLPEDQRAKFGAFPTQAAEAMFREQPETFRQMTNDEIRAQGLPSGNYQISNKTGKISELGKPPVAVTVKTGQAYGEALGAGAAKADLDLYAQASSAPQALDTVERTKEILDSGKVFTGKGASVKLELARFGQAIGLSGQNQDQLIANTTELMKDRAKATLNAIKGSGLGSGQGFTDKDRQFLENAQLGNVTYDRESLKRQVILEERVNKAIIEKWNSRLKSIPKESISTIGFGEVQWTPQKVKRYDPESGGLK